MVDFLPHNYQQRGIDCILKNKGCALFYQMGAGKTATTLQAIDKLVNEQLEVKKVLIIGPLRVITSTWPDEIEKWGFNLSYSLLTGTKKQREKALEKEADLYLIGKENVCWLVEKTQECWPFDMVVVDELSSFKNPQAKRFKALKKMPYKRFVGLSGTPAPSGIPDLWSQLYLMDKGKRLYPHISQFRERWLYPEISNGFVVYRYGLKPGALEDIEKRISDICMSISAEEYSTLPDVIQIDSKIDPGEKLLKQYQTLKKDLIFSLEGDRITAANAGVLAGKLQQYTSGQIYTEENGLVTVHDLKLERLLKLMEEAEKEPVLIFYYFRHEKERILKALKKEGYKCCALSSTEDIDRWNRKKLDALLLQPQSAGHGLNLQKGGHLAIWYSLPNWNLESYQQANARLVRQGQEHKVRIYHLVLKGTIDEIQLASLNSKENLQTKLIEALNPEN